MRKFKISERVARKMKELGSMGQDGTKETPEAAAEAKDAAPDAVPEKKENLRVTSRTDVGLVRKNNQDAVIMGSGLMGIADGMGGHRGGETASAGARDGLIRLLAGKEPSREILENAVRAIREADTLIVGGTSLVVYPAAGLIDYFRGKHLVLINKTATKADSMAELVIRDAIGKVLSEAAGRVFPGT